MADLPSNDEMLEQYFASDDNQGEFEGFDIESDVDVPNALNSSDVKDENKMSLRKQDHSFPMDLTAIPLLPWIILI